MTRINLVPPSQLTDKHLVAEYRELPRIFTAVLKLQENGIGPESIDISESYTLGKGHMKFFYNKIAYLRYRYESLYSEMKGRDFKPDEDLFKKILFSTNCIHGHWQGQFYPTPEDLYLNMIRICKRSNIGKVLDELAA